MILFPKLSIGYQDLPKVASTSLFNFFHISMYGSEYVPTGNVHIHGYFNKSLCPDVQVTSNHQKQHIPFRDFFRFTITRDPIKRFLSMYSNRVIYHRELSINSKSSQRLIKSGLNCDPQINELIDSWDAYLECANTIKHHASPMIDFLGPDLSVYNRIEDISKLGNVIDDIKTHWLRQGMIDVLKRAPTELPRQQTGGPKLGLEVFAPKSFERLLDYYREDYAHIPTISVQAIKDEYAKARQSVTTVGPVVFPPLKPMKQSKVEAKHEVQTISVKNEDCPLVQMVRVFHRDQNVKQLHTLKGVVLLKPEIAKDNWKLVMSDGEKDNACQWGQHSPKIAEQFPDNQNATHARFKVEGRVVTKEKPLELYLLNKEGERHLLAEIKAAD